MAKAIVAIVIVIVVVVAFNAIYSTAPATGSVVVPPRTSGHAVVGDPNAPAPWGTDYGPIGPMGATGPR